MAYICENTTINPIPKPCRRHKWWVFSTATRTVSLLVYCKQCGCTGVVNNPTKKEWGRAFTAPSKHYRWRKNRRVSQ